MSIFPSLWYECILALMCVLHVYINAYMWFLFCPIILLELVANRTGSTEKGS